MNPIDFALAMSYLYEIEWALDSIATAVGHPVMDEFFNPEN